MRYWKDRRRAKHAAAGGKTKGARIAKNRAGASIERNPPGPTPDLTRGLPTKEVARRLGRTKRTVEREIVRGRLKAYRPGLRGWVVLPEDLDTYVASSVNVAPKV